MNLSSSISLYCSKDIDCVIVKQGGEYCVKSEDKSKNLGCKTSKSGAKRRLQQVDYFKNLKGGGVGSGRKKGSSSKKWSKMSEEERRSAARNDPRQMKLFDKGFKVGKDTKIRMNPSGGYSIIPNGHQRKMKKW